jgi:DNA-binding transcriptional MerR regulator
MAVPRSKIAQSVSSDIAPLPVAPGNAAPLFIAPPQGVHAQTLTGNAIFAGTEKSYFRIGEVAQLLGVEAHVLRYWEREFRGIKPAKSSRGQRVYSRANVAQLAQIQHLLYVEKFTIAGAKKQLSGANKRAGAHAVTEARTSQSTGRTDYMHTAHYAASGATYPPAAPPDTTAVTTLARTAAKQSSTQHTAPVATAPDALALAPALARLLTVRAELEAFLLELAPSP